MPRTYDPSARGSFGAGVRTFTIEDGERQRRFPCEAWYPSTAVGSGELRDAPAVAGLHPLALFSHASGCHRRQSTFLCQHLASHGYIVAALDHSEVVAPELRRPDGESGDGRAKRIQAWIANRVPDVRLLLDRMLDGQAWPGLGRPDPVRVAVMGHSFGGWTALAVPETDARVRAIVALAPAGASNPPPGIIPCTLTFAWGREIPTLYLVARDDADLPISGMHELFERTRSPKRMFVLERAGHGHFFDEFAAAPGQCTATEAHEFVRRFALAHLDHALRADAEARLFLDRTP